MTLPTSRNPISFSQIEAEFGGNSTNSFGGYRMGTPESYGGKTFDELDTGIPTSGTINYGSFSGKQVHVVVDCHSGSTENRVNARSKYDGNNIDNVGEGILNSPKAVRKTDTSGSRLWIRVNKTIGSQTSDGTQTVCALRTGDWEAGTPVDIEMGGSSKILGAGGAGGAGGTGSDGGGDAGSPGVSGNSALGIDYYGTNVKIEDNAMLVGGYGGGGGGGAVGTDDGLSGENGGGGAGGGGAGLPGGIGGVRGEGRECDGGTGGNGEEPFLSQEDSGAGGGGCDSGGDDEGGTESGAGGRGGDMEGVTAVDGEQRGESKAGGTAGVQGAAIRTESGVVFTWADGTSNDPSKIFGVTNGSGVT